MGRNNGTYEMDTAPDDIRQLGRKHESLEVRVQALEKEVRQIIMYLNAQIKPKKPKKSKAEKAQAKMCKRRRAEDVAADPGAAY